MLELFLGFTGLDTQKKRGKTEAYQWKAKGKIYTPIMFGSRHLRHLSKGNYGTVFFKQQCINGNTSISLDEQKHHARLGRCSCKTLKPTETVEPFPIRLAGFPISLSQWLTV